MNQPTPSPVVAVTGLWKQYGSTVALGGVSFQVGPGQVFGLLGPNGAGKTTTLECILGLRQPDRGAIHINGLDLRTHSRQAKLMLGAQLQSSRLQDRLTPREALDFFGSFYAEPFESDELLRRFELEPKADAPFASLSGGQRQRLFLALAMVNRPTLLLLDEPTAGLDPQARRELRGLIAGLKAEGRTVLLSTHDLDEAGELCDQVAILDRGRIIAVAPPSELIDRSNTPARVLVRSLPPLSAAVVNSLPDVTRAVQADRGWLLDTPAPSRLLAEVVRRADEVGSELVEVGLRRPTLEDVFLELTGRPWSTESEPGVIG